GPVAGRGVRPVTGQCRLAIRPLSAPAVILRRSNVPPTPGPTYRGAWSLATQVFPLLTDEQGRTIHVDWYTLQLRRQVHVCIRDNQRFRRRLKTRPARHPGQITPSRRCCGDRTADQSNQSQGPARRVRWRQCQVPGGENQCTVALTRE